ncbi:MAG: diaminopimelate decarboxylase [Dehalococcoidia bacterium]|nr:diaminopimelate decarboxylase [Dehalococcoidia bacterium]
MAWEVEFTDQFEEWWDSLTQEQQEALDARVSLLADAGPALGRPTVDHVESSRHANMKELRASRDGALRVLFAFDPRRTAILLIGGNKSGEWDEWYRTAVPIADDLFEEHLAELRREGLTDAED